MAGDRRNSKSKGGKKKKKGVDGVRLMKKDDTSSSTSSSSLAIVFDAKRDDVRKKKKACNKFNNDSKKGQVGYPTSTKKKVKKQHKDTSVSSEQDDSIDEKLKEKTKTKKKWLSLKRTRKWFLKHFLGVNQNAESPEACSSSKQKLQKSKGKAKAKTKAAEKESSSETVSEDEEDTDSDEWVDTDSEDARRLKEEAKGKIRKKRKPSVLTPAMRASKRFKQLKHFSPNAGVKRATRSKIGVDDGNVEGRHDAQVHDVDDDYDIVHSEADSWNIDKVGSRVEVYAATIVENALGAVMCARDDLLEKKLNDLSVMLLRGVLPGMRGKKGRAENVLVSGDVQVLRRACWLEAHANVKEYRDLVSNFGASEACGRFEWKNHFRASIYGESGFTKMSRTDVCDIDQITADKFVLDNKKWQLQMSSFASMQQDVVGGNESHWHDGICSTSLVSLNICRTCRNVRILDPLKKATLEALAAIVIPIGNGRKAHLCLCPKKTEALVCQDLLEMCEVQMLDCKKSVALYREGLLKRMEENDKPLLVVEIVEEQPVTRINVEQSCTGEIVLKRSKKCVAASKAEEGCMLKVKEGAFKVGKKTHCIDFDVMKVEKKKEYKQIPKETAKESRRKKVKKQKQPGRPSVISLELIRDSSKHLHARAKLREVIANAPRIRVFTCIKAQSREELRCFAKEFLLRRTSYETGKEIIEKPARKKNSKRRKRIDDMDSFSNSLSLVLKSPSIETLNKCSKKEKKKKSSSASIVGKNMSGRNKIDKVFQVANNEAGGGQIGGRATGNAGGGAGGGDGGGGGGGSDPDDSSEDDVSDGEHGGNHGFNGIAGGGGGDDPSDPDDDSDDEDGGEGDNGNDANNQGDSDDEDSDSDEEDVVVEPDIPLAVLGGVVGAGQVQPTEQEMRVNKVQTYRIAVRGVLRLPWLNLLLKSNVQATLLKFEVTGWSKYVCEGCGARLFREEVESLRHVLYMYSSCCARGTLRRDGFLTRPEGLRILAHNIGEDTNYKAKTKCYNDLVSLARMNHNLHRLGLLANSHLSVDGVTHELNTRVLDRRTERINDTHNYFYYVDVGRGQNVEMQQLSSEEVEIDTLNTVVDTVREVNPYVNAFEDIRGEMNADAATKLVITIEDEQQDEVSELVGSGLTYQIGGEETETGVTMKVRRQGVLNNNRRIEVKQMHPLSDPLMFVSLFPAGEAGFIGKKDFVYGPFHAWRNVPFAGPINRLVRERAWQERLNAQNDAGQNPPPPAPPNQDDAAEAAIVELLANLNEAQEVDVDVQQAGDAPAAAAIAAVVNHENLGDLRHELGLDDFPIERLRRLLLDPVRYPTINEYYRYILYERWDSDLLHLGGEAFQAWVLWAYSKVRVNTISMMRFLRKKRRFATHKRIREFAHTIREEAERQVNIGNAQQAAAAAGAQVPQPPVPPPIPADVQPVQMNAALSDDSDNERGRPRHQMAFGTSLDFACASLRGSRRWSEALYIKRNAVQVQKGVATMIVTLSLNHQDPDLHHLMVTACPYVPLQMDEPAEVGMLPYDQQRRLGGSWRGGNGRRVGVHPADQGPEWVGQAPMDDNERERGRGRRVRPARFQRRSFGYRSVDGYGNGRGYQSDSDGGEARGIGRTVRAMGGRMADAASRGMRGRGACRVDPPWKPISVRNVRGGANQGQDPPYVNPLEEGFFNQNIFNRPDLVARKARLVFESVRNDFKRELVFGDLVYYMDFVEFGGAKGVVHLHVVVKMVHEPQSVQEADKWLSAQIPDEHEHPVLYSLMHLQVHKCHEGNRDNACIVDGVCKKGYPKEYSNVTRIRSMVDGTVQLARPMNDRFVQIGEERFDNSHIEPYSPFLLLKYRCNMSAKLCEDAKPVRYFCKNVCMNDKKQVTIKRRTEEEMDVAEMNDILFCRKTTAVEAAWHLFNFDTGVCSVSVQCLLVHKPNEQLIYFNEDRLSVLQAAEDPTAGQTQLTQFFEVNRRIAEGLDEPIEGVPEGGLLYEEMLGCYKWVPKNWVRRDGQAGMFGISKEAIALLKKQGKTGDKELEYLTKLLRVIRGPTSFEFLRTVNGILYDTFAEAAEERQMANSHVDDALRDMIAEMNCRRIDAVRTFAVGVGSGVVTSPRQLWGTLQPWLNMVGGIDQQNALQEEMRCEMNRILVQHSTDANTEGLAQPGQQIGLNEHYLLSFRMEPQMAFDRLEELDDNGQGFDAQQAHVMHLVRQAMMRRNAVDQQKMFFVLGAAGTGKSRLFHALYLLANSLGLLCLCVAYSGAAASLLPNGMTAHGAFGINPRSKDEVTGQSSSTNIPEESIRALLLRNVDIVLWDEASMCDKASMNVASKALYRSRNPGCVASDESKFGGCIIVFAGDFRQTSPIINEGNPSLVAEASIKRHDLMNHCEFVTLVENHRIGGNQGFADWLVNVGSPRDVQGRLILPAPNVELTEGGMFTNELIDSVFGDEYVQDVFNSTAILCPLNVTANNYNAIILTRYFAEEDIRTYEARSMFIVEPTSAIQQDMVPEDVDVPNIPPHVLKLCVGAVVVCLKNLDIHLGVVNGARMRIAQMEDDAIKVQIISGNGAGTFYYLSRLIFKTTDFEYSHVLERAQFPVKLAFAMTANKAQGLTLERVGIDLYDKQFFSHGQCYVAFSRVRNPNNLFVRTRFELIKNVVNKQVLFDPDE